MNFFRFSSCIWQYDWIIRKISIFPWEKRLLLYLLYDINCFISNILNRYLFYVYSLIRRCKSTIFIISLQYPKVMIPVLGNLSIIQGWHLFFPWHYRNPASGGCILFSGFAYRNPRREVLHPLVRPLCPLCTPFISPSEGG